MHLFALQNSVKMILFAKLDRFSEQKKYLFVAANKSVQGCNMCEHRLAVNVLIAYDVANDSAIVNFNTNNLIAIYSCTK